jgi:RNA polymerase sigma factor (sigma-70 family)
MVRVERQIPFVGFAIGDTSIFAAVEQGGMDHESDESLMTRVTRGDRPAYEALYARWRKPLFRFLCRRTGCLRTAEEALQETWLRVYRYRASYDRARRFKSWLFTIAANCGRDAWPAAQEAPLFIEPLQDEPHDLRDRLLEGLARLDPEERRLLLLATEGFDGPEIAAMLGISAGAVRMRLSRARQRMREQLGGPHA